MEFHARLDLEIISSPSVLEIDVVPDNGAAFKIKNAAGAKFEQRGQETLFKWNRIIDFVPQSTVDR